MLTAFSHRVFVAGLATTLALAPTAAYATTLDLNFGALDFSNPDQPSPGVVQDLGEDLDPTDNPNYVDYEEVVSIGGTVVDARVTLVRTVNLDNSGGTGVDYLDEDPRESIGEVGLDDSGISPQIDLADDGQEGYAEIRISFLDALDSSSVTLQNIALNIKDVDSNQFVELSPSSYSLSSNPRTVLSVTDKGSGLFRFSSGPESSNDEDEQNWVFARYASASSITVIVGKTSGSGSASFDLLFSALSFTPLPTQEQSSEPPEPAAVPLLHMDVLGEPGVPVSSVELLFEGEGLSRGTPYSLFVDDSRQLASGVVGRYGFFSEKLSLDSFGPGEHRFTLRTTAPDGSLLVLSKTLRVGASGEILGLTQGVTGPVLATTGPGDGVPWLGVAGLALGVLGTALVAASYRRFVAEP